MHNIIPRHNDNGFWFLIILQEVKIYIPSICSNQCLPFVVNVDLREKAGLDLLHGVPEGVLQMGVTEGERTMDVGGL